MILALGVATVLVLLAVIVFLLVMYLKRTYDDTNNLTPESEASSETYWCTGASYDQAIPYNFEHVQLLTSASDIIYKIFELISSAEKCIVLSTYRWRLEPHKIHNRPNSQIIAIGYALTKLSTRCKKQGKNIRFSILCNQMLLGKESDKWLEQHLVSTLQCWKQIGFIPVSGPEEPGVYIHFKTWAHVSLGNLHSKFVIVDHEKVATYSMNIEGYSHGEIGTWREIGISFQSSGYAKYMNDYFHTLFEQGKQFDVYKLSQKICKPELYDVSYIFPDPNKRIECSTVPGLLLANVARPFAVDRKNPIMTQLIPLLRSASKSIYITTPNLNDIAILNIITTKMKEGIEVKIILNKGFNVDVPPIQEALLGWSTNEQQLSKWKETGLVHCMRWNGENGVAVNGKVEHQLHAKTFLVDNMSLVIGSFNADIYSTISSAELVVLMQSTELVHHFLHTWFDPLWNQAVPL